MLIRAYGLYWNPDTVDWGSRGRGNQGTLQGKVRISGRVYTIDFWDAYSVYALHDQFRPIYVGKAGARGLGPRLRDHLADRFAGRWDMFSWFSLSTVNTTYGNVRAPGTRQVSPKTVMDTLEALGILMTDPPLNRKRERVPSAVSVEQVRSPHPKTIRRYLEEILNKLS
jgi:hypothetical protein